MKNIPLFCTISLIVCLPLIIPKQYDPVIYSIRYTIKTLKPSINDSICNKISNAIIIYGNKYNIPYNDLITIAYLESSINPTAYNKTSRDYGLMQINWKWWGKSFCKSPKELYDINKNIEIACIIICSNKEKGKTLSYYHSSNNRLRDIYQRKINITLARI